MGFDTGNGTLNVEAGGVVSNTIGFIGLRFRFDGQATVTGSGSQWNNSSGLSVGSGRQWNAERIEAGGVVSNTNGYIGCEISVRRGPPR